MRKIITLILSIFTFGYTQGQAPAIEWQKSFGGTRSDMANAIKPTSDGGYVVAGNSTSVDDDVTGNHGGGYYGDYWVIKLDATGIKQWQKSLGGSGDDAATSIETTPDGGYVVAGTSNSNDGDVTGNHGLIDYWVVKLDVAGNIQWQKSLGGSGDDTATSIEATSDGGYIVAGYSYSINGDVTGHHGGNFQEDVWVVKLDAVGNILWQKSLGGAYGDSANCIQNTSDGGYIVAGYSNSFEGDITENHGARDFWVIKLNAFGTIEWQKSIGGWGVDVASSIQTTSDGGYIVAGSSTSIYGTATGTRAEYDYWVVKIDAVGTIQWQKSIGYSQNDNAYAIQTASDGGYVVAGSSYLTIGEGGHHTDYDYWVVKLDSFGILQWQKFLGGSKSDIASSILTTSDGGYVIGGLSDSENYDITGNIYSYDYWIVKLSPDTLANPILEKQEIVIYPNPVCDVLQIQTPANATITDIKITDMNGRVVFEQSQNSNTINIENLAQGIYVLEVYSGEDKYVSKFVKE